MAPGYQDDVLASIRALSMRCKENILMLDEELRQTNPDAEDRCGLLADRYEVYAMTIPGCREARLAVSIDFRSRAAPPPAMLHGAVPAAGACAGARQRAVLHRNLVNPSWE